MKGSNLHTYPKISQTALEVKIKGKGHLRTALEVKIKGKGHLRTALEVKIKDKVTLGRP
jgi:hypothetical protein